ncbi:MAG: uroporphyrinogen-III synthase [Bacteroidota bacterium]
MNILTLSGKTILITRPKDSSADLRSLLESRKASVICFPAIEISDPESWEACDRTIWKLAEYSSVCFTSKNAVIKFVERIRSIRPQAVDTLATRNIFAVGEKTKRSLESCGFSVLATPKHASAEELTTMLQAHQIKGAKILFPKSSIAREELPKQLRSMGAVVDELVVYQTIIPEPDNLERIRQMFLENKIDVATFFSPSSILNFTEMIGLEVLAHTAIAAIGPTTAETAQQLGLTVAILAQQATAEGLVEAIENYVQ